ncbi:flagellar hook-associated protein FlgK [Engelhardtia mirabilis]|uniref:Flagellar hook-associated protein 1 n=1 Tax=Engelhardtia mirabilis TaxID=2528011 RepID=A0A518BSY3_9BACT|nr:Flagellar hook-associated protein 1 [Planctomycetes bacterium Pla133]QDV04403.1 Flagellar hook-associated protein 1 [Planctomycetes bacterium Pla86]
MSRIGLGTGLRALLASQFALNTVGQNIANANTPGYSRQGIELGASRPQNLGRFFVGSGVEVLGVNRKIDELLERRILTQTAITGRLDQTTSTLSEIEALFADFEGYGLGSQMDDFFSSTAQLSANPQDPILQSGVVQSAVQMSARFQSLYTGLQDLGSEIGVQAKVLSGDANQLATEIARLNGEIAQAESAGVLANDLRDSRQLALKELSELVDVKATEDGQGMVRVQVAGNILVNGTTAQKLTVETNANNELALRISGSNGFVPIEGGRLGGLVDVREGTIPGLGSELNALARELIISINAKHSVGVPASGSFQNLTSSYQAKDVDGDGQAGDELLRDSLPFAVTDGNLVVNISNRDTGAIERYEIEIDAERTTVDQFAAALSKVPRLNAELDPFGRLQIVADAGFGFDFSKRLDPNPDPDGTFGGGGASLGTPEAGPFNLADGDTLEIEVPAGGGGTTTVQVEFDLSSFVDITEATADEVAAAISSSPDVIAAGLRAVVQDGHVFLQTEDTGASAQFTVQAGSAITALGWDDNAGIPVTGSADAVDIVVSGVYELSKNNTFSFVPRNDGVIGTTPDLIVDVFDAEGEIVTSLQVGAGYQPGTKLTVVEGVEVTLGLGSLSASNNDRVAFDVVADSDESDVLVAFGINSFLTGTDASDIGVRTDLEFDASLLAGSATGAEGDNGVLLSIVQLESEHRSGLGGETIGGRYARTVGDFGFELASADSALSASGVLVDSLESRRAAVSGVNVDEELVDMVRFEQAYNAAARFIDVVSRLEQELLQII